MATRAAAIFRRSSLLSSNFGFRSTSAVLSAHSYSTDSSEAAREGHESGSIPESSEGLIQWEQDYSAHNYHPLPVVFARAKGVHVWDPEGRKYMDFLAGYSALNQGHCHDKITAALLEQAQRLTLSSRAFHNDKMPIFAKLLTSTFGYDMMLPMNTGAEGVETAVKLVRKWGYEKKKIPNNKALIVSCCGSFHGRTMQPISMSCDNDATRGFGPLVPGHVKVDFGDVEALSKVLREDGSRVAGFLVEPIQGEAGVVIPPDGYLRAARELCSKYNVLMIADEIQTGIGRTGKLLACEWEGVRPDVVILGKALGGGMLPVSAVLADKNVMLCIRPGEHGSTFGGNPLSSAVGIASLQVVLEENLSERAFELGERFRKQLVVLKENFPKLIRDVRGKGLLNAVEIYPASLAPASAYDLCVALKDRGILTKATHETVVRLTPPLTISSEQLDEAAKAFHDVLKEDVPQLQSQPRAEKAYAEPEACDRCGRHMYIMPETDL